MALTLFQAGLLADVMTPEAIHAFKHMAGMSDKDVDNAPIEAVDELFTLDLIERTKNLLNGQEVVVLTDRGKKVAKVLTKRVGAAKEKS